ncbi:aromatic acid exporter family protein [Alkalihalobacillus sp. LMS39]|uniref:aromatic acid exporter family protein n=1 Tax=Alkalihalobacillus sp. LMS39 TaxID=2924032 RepID=UPI001FB2BC54|nr:aromatic acid exporter family protein [Alkalihalobacillus sp. LMS39]UOE92999.1 aromatic acid exporter family protein [Alkalihalobacillus sp. LMS39]
MNITKWFGRRVLKTGLAVFVTATICQLLDLPVIFAIITAIVTTEPTAADSIKKGVIRLPAAAIGALFAIVFDMLLGHSALTYAIVSMLTIIACAKLKLDTGTLVATLTAVAMIPGTSDSFTFDFMMRLSGTTIGIIVSTLVNFVVLPPQFGPLVVKKVDYLYDEVANTCNSIVHQLTDTKNQIHHSIYRSLTQELEKAIQLTQFQEDEWKYRKFNDHEKRSFEFLQQKLTLLQQIIFHLGSLSYVNIQSHELAYDEITLLSSAGADLSTMLKDPYHQLTKEHTLIIDQLQNQLSDQTHFVDEQPNTIANVYYELLLIYQLTMEVASITEKERLFSESNATYPKYIFAERVQYD